MRTDGDTDRASFRLRPAALAAIASIPAAWTLLLVRSLIQRPLQAFVPSKWNDAVGYWHQIKSFSKVGFACGYYGWNEITPPLAALHYDVHGPLFPMLYGSMASVFGWAPWSAFFYNWVVLTVGVTSFGMIAALTPRQVALLGGLLGCCWTIPLYLLPPNQEPVHMAAGFVFAALFGRLLFDSRPLSRIALATAWAFLTVMSLMRLSWCILAVPLLILGGRRRSKRAVLGALAVGALYTIAVTYVFRAIAAPGGNSVVDLFDGLLDSPRSLVQAVAATVVPNVKATFTGGRFGTVQAWLYLGLLLALSGIGVVTWHRRSTGRATATATTGALREVSFQVYQLGSMLLACWLNYYPSGYERVLLPHLVLSLALLVVARRKWLILAVIVSMALAAPRGWNDFKNDYSTDLHVDTAVLRATRDALQQLAPYQKDAPSPWCNTMLIDLPQDDWHTIAIPVGLGRTWVSKLDPPRHPLFSRWVWATPELLERLHSVHPSAELTLMGRFADGMDLYRNERSACEEER